MYTHFESDTDRLLFIGKAKKAKKEKKEKRPRADSGSEEEKPSKKKTRLPAAEVPSPTRNQLWGNCENPLGRTVPSSL